MLAMASNVVTTIIDSQFYKEWRNKDIHRYPLGELVGFPNISLANDRGIGAEWHWYWDPATALAGPSSHKSRLWWALKITFRRSERVPKI